MGNLESAMNDMNEAIRLNPRYDWAYADRALVNTFLGNDVAARLDIDRAVELGFNRDLLNAEIEMAKTQR